MPLVLNTTTQLLYLSTDIVDHGELLDGKLLDFIYGMINPNKHWFCRMYDEIVWVATLQLTLVCNNFSPFLQTYYTIKSSPGKPTCRVTFFHASAVFNWFLYVNRVKSHRTGCSATTAINISSAISEQMLDSKLCSCSLGPSWPRDDSRTRHPHWLLHGFSTWTCHSSLHKVGVLSFFLLLIHLFHPPPPFPLFLPSPPGSQYKVNDFWDHFPFYAPLIWTHSYRTLTFTRLIHKTYEFCYVNYCVHSMQLAVVSHCWLEWGCWFLQSQ